MPERETIRVEVVTVAGTYVGEVTLPSAARLLDVLNTTPDMIALTRACRKGDAGPPIPFLALNKDQILTVAELGEA